MYYGRIRIIYNVGNRNDGRIYCIYNRKEKTRIKTNIEKAKKVLTSVNVFGILVKLSQSSTALKQPNKVQKTF